MKEIPDFDIELAQATDYILRCPLANKAFSCPPFQNFANIVTDTIRWIDQLADNCHMPEFTNHALPHICSIVKRASEWGERDGWLKDTTPQEAGYLLIALLIHDIGMLSQDSRDIPEEQKLQHLKGLSDISGWVRRTHVIRIEMLVKNFLAHYTEQDPSLTSHLDVIIGMAQSHSKWPWEPDFVTNREQIASLGLDAERIGALNAVIAVCDLLDEDSKRCDTVTLIKHRFGTITNRAHWIRHALTKRVEGVKNHSIIVQFRRLPSKSPHLEILYRTLRNHYRLVKLYQENLAVIHAELLHMHFEPGDGIPDEEDEVSKELLCYRDIPELRHDIVPHLLATFMKEARNQADGDPAMRKRLDKIGLETIDLSDLSDFFHPNSLLYPEERVIFGKGTVDEKLTYIHDLAEKSYVNGEIEKLRHICGAAITMLEPPSIKPAEIYWAITYLLIYEKDQMDFYTAEQIHVNLLDNRYNNYVDEIPVTIPAQEPYQGLLDVLLYFLRPHITSESLDIYLNYLKEYNYENLKDDFATFLLAQTVIGLFWFWDHPSTAWRELSVQIQQQAKNNRLPHMLRAQQKRLELQYKMLYGSSMTEEKECMEMDDPVLAKGWMHFFQADWKKVAEDIPLLIACAERNPDLFGSVQGYQNITYLTLECNDLNQNLKSENYDKTGFHRYQRNAGEQERSEFWQSRQNVIETLLSKLQMEPTSNEAPIIRVHIIRLISLRKLESLQYWNIAEYLESVRNEARIYYDLAAFEDKYGTYQGLADDLPNAIISSIQSLDSKQLTKEEMQRLITKMYYHHPEGYEEVVRFIISNPQKCTWSYEIPWIEHLMMDLNPIQLSQVLKWIVIEYDPFIQTQKQHLDLAEYEFLWQSASKFSDDDWNILLPIIRRTYKNYFLYNANSKSARNSLSYMPSTICQEIITLIESWTFEPMVRNAIYEICIGISKKRDHTINTRLHQFVQKCQTEDPCELYQNLEQLIDIDNLLERTEIDTEGICQAVENTVRQLNNINLSRYDSRFFQELIVKFTNQNWSLMPEEKVLDISRRFLGLLENQKEISSFYFCDICELLSKISRLTEKKVQREIAVYFVEAYILPDAIAEITTDRQKDPTYGPLSNFHLPFFNNKNPKPHIFSVLLNCITEIPENYQERCLRWAWECLAEDDTTLYYYAVLFISYYYFNGNNNIKKTALAGLLYIRGRLETQNKQFESQLNHVLHAWKSLESADRWFPGQPFKQLAEQEKDYQQLFQKPIEALMKKSGNPEIRHWKEVNLA